MRTEEEIKRELEYQKSILRHSRSPYGEGSVRSNIRTLEWVLEK